MHKEIEATVSTIESFREFYNLDNLILSGNDSDSLNQLLRKYELKNLNSMPYIGPLLEAQKNREINSWDADFAIDLVQIQMENLANALRKLATSHILYLHPDHRIVGKIRSYEDISLDITTPNKYTKDVQSKLIAEFGPQLIMKKYGIPSVINRQDFLDVYDFFKRNRQTMLKLAEITSNRVAFDDYLIPILFKLCDLPISNRKLTRELQRRKSLLYMKAPILHQVR